MPCSNCARVPEAEVCPAMIAPNTQHTSSLCRAQASMLWKALRLLNKIQFTQRFLASPDDKGTASYCQQNIQFGLVQGKSGAYACSQGTRRTHKTTETRCACLRTLLKGVNRTSCHRAEALATLGGRLWETPLTAAKGCGNSAAVVCGADDAQDAALSRALVHTSLHTNWLAAGFCVTLKFPLTQE